MPYSFLPHAGPHNMPHFMSHPAFVQPYAAYDTTELRPPMAMGFDPTFQQTPYQQSAIQPQHGQTQPAQDAKFGMNPPVQRTNSGKLLSCLFDLLSHLLFLTSSLTHSMSLD